MATKGFKSVVSTAAAMFAFAVSAAIEFKSGGALFRLSDDNGAVKSLRDADGVERIGFATNWWREPSDLKVAHSDGRMETRRLAPLETIELQ